MGHHDINEHHAGVSLAAPLIGAPAPEFKGTAYFKDYDGEGFKEISLDDYKGKWVILVFFPAAFTGVCASEVKAFSEEIASFAGEGAELVGISGDSQFALKAWAQSGEVGEVKFPLLSDLNHYAGAAYQVYNCPAGLNYRGLFIVNPGGVVMHAVLHHFAIGRNTSETLRVLQALKSGGVCMANWKK